MCLKSKAHNLGKMVFTVAALCRKKGDLVQELWKRLTEALCRERRSETQNSHQACPRKIFQQAVIAVKPIHAAFEGESSGK